ncbi:MAG TPA: glycoside hydrolase family 15 protein [Mycobacteriales bacterium]|nr:glycoside hydrolase family 15 protein [Mycobacteriales bacterium]
MRRGNTSASLRGRNPYRSARGWTCMTNTQPIESYGLLGDMQTVGLVSRTGSVDWLCFPRFDSAACFTALLGTPDDGHWRLAPTGADECTRRSYRGDSLILETEWETATGAVKVIDFMPPRGEAPDIVRIVEGVSGEVDMTTELRIRFDYGAIVPWLRRRDGSLHAVAGPDSVHLRTPVRMHAHDLAHIGTFTVTAGQRVPFVLTWQASHLPAPEPVDPEQALADTESYWADWMKLCSYDGEWRDAVVRSLITLKALTYAPTGGIVAAATTSLPEALGGERNWDYRFCWLRDASMTLQALLYTGFVDEAKAWREWLLRAVAGDAQRLRIMYGLGGERRIPEFELPWLSGYAASAPVRVGNAASDQFQLDVYGEVLDALHLDRCSGLSPLHDVWSVQRAILDVLEQRWDQPDQGIWEMRGEPRHFVHSKVMAWVGFDRAIRGVEQFDLDGPVDRWRELRDRIHSEVCANGYDAKRNTFTQSYGSPALDAALLLIPQVGFLPPDDERVVGTVDAIYRELLRDGFLLRYDNAHADDGFSSDEGAFIACTLWLVDSLHLVGREDDARAVFEQVLSVRNDVGLLAEEFDPGARRQLGNVPQAYSHVAIVNAARALSRHGANVGRVDRDRPRARDGQAPR